MEHKQLVDALTKKLGRNKTDINKLIDALSGVVKTHCGELDNVAMPGFGTFEPEKMMERVVKDADTGKRTLMPPRVALRFKLSNVLRSKMN